MYINEMSVVILAAGKGSRMYSNLPKVLHTIAGKPIIQHIIDTVLSLNARKIHIVYGYGGNLLKSVLSNNNMINWVLQKHQLGTGHAIQQVASFFKQDEDILVLNGDVPFIAQQTLQKLCETKPYGGIGLITAVLDNPNGYGRIIRKDNSIIGIVEHKDASSEQIKINEINTGIIIANGGDLKRWLKKLNNNNVQEEFYVTDIIAIAKNDNCPITAVNPSHNIEIKGVNNIFQLVKLEKKYQRQQAEKLLLNGVILRDPERFDLRGNLKCGHDVEIDINVILEGEVTLGNHVKIGAGCIIRNSIIADNCSISPYTIIENSNLGYSCTVGPFANLRLGCILDDQAHVGNFVEMKKTIFGQASKVGHLSYLGDAEVGNKVNIGAGTITCNYDGNNKFKTIIGNNVFIGCDTQLIAPLKIVNDATIAAGTTVMKDVHSADLIYNYKEQNQKSGWQRSIKKNKS